MSAVVRLFDALVTSNNQVQVIVGNPSVNIIGGY